MGKRKEAQDQARKRTDTAGPVLSQIMADYVRECANRLELRDWTLAVSAEDKDRPDDEDRAACVQCTVGRKHAFIWFDPAYVLSASPRDLRQTTAHELLHVHMQGAREVAFGMIVAGYKGKAATALTGVYDTTLEQPVDALAWVVAPTLPYPPTEITGIADPEE